MWSSDLRADFAHSVILPFRKISDTVGIVKKNHQPSEGLRQRKQRETRTLLSHATIRFCMQRGWENVTIEDIAAAANVSPRTFRNYFSTKAEAVAAGHLERMLRIADALRVRPAKEDLWTAITSSVAAQFEPPEQKSAPTADTKNWLERIRFVLREPAIRGEVLKASAVAQHELAKAIAERTGSRHGNELYSQITSGVIIAVVGVVQERWLRDGARGSIVPLLRAAFRQVSKGLPQKAHPSVEK
jgi:AcrR family transcriptional regulator